jgi:hypothetical protein
MNEDFAMKILGCVLIAAVCLTAGPVLAGKKKEEAAAETPAAAGGAKGCVTNYSQQGSFMSGRTFNTWDIVQGVSVSTAFKRIYSEGVKSGLKVSSSDEKIGSIIFEQANAGSTFGAQTMVNLPWNVLIEPQGKNVKVSVTKTTPASLSATKEFQMKSMCAVIDAARNK